jgi:polysaccharide deacetylase 2 family uncharacterized protein YibQ
MAFKSRNSKTSKTKKRSSTIKKSSSKQKPKNKKRNTGKNRKSSASKKGLLFSLVLFLMVSLVSFGYYLGQSEENSFLNTNITDVLSSKKVEKHPETSKIFSKVKTKHPKHTHKDEANKPKKDKVALAYRTKKPKLVIIIDDVSNAKQLQRIRALKIPVTPSIFPPSKLSMKSHELANGLKHYMIHLPMESGSQKFNSQYKTLKTSFTKAQMEARMKEIRILFPAARYINNHTGSVFTNDYKAMHTLYGIMKKKGFIFIDSRTIGSTKVRDIAHEYGDAYVARDIFIDNRHSISYIHQQLKKAVKIAKRKGYAIAIGHPHKVTMQALASSGDILKDVELVYIDQIYQKH